MIFTKEECNTIIEWDYKEWIRVSNFSGLVDCGITSKINKVSASIHKKTLRGGSNKIVINPIHKSILLKNEYYNGGDETFGGGRYKIEFSEFINTDTICLYNDKIESEEFINTLNLTPNMMQKKKKDYLGIIKIKNIYI
jgi:hypothetical protein